MAKLCVDWVGDLLSYFPHRGFDPAHAGGEFYHFAVHRHLVDFSAYLGDVAGYLGAHPDTVAGRHLVRDRGLQLLRRLHEDPAYERIVIVAHSLGSVVAYDILHLLWEELGPTNENPPGKQVRQALANYDHLVLELNQKYGIKRWSDQDLQRYCAAQSNVSDAIRAQGTVPRKDGRKSNAYWKITDFITAGSPLSHAQFLLARGAVNFGKLKKRTVVSHFTATSVQR